MPFKNYIVSNFKHQSDMDRPFTSLSFIYLLADPSVVDRIQLVKKIGERYNLIVSVTNKN